MIEIIRGVVQKPASTQILDQYFQTSHLTGVLFLGYPLAGIGRAVDALLITQEYGITIFDLLDGRSTESRSSVQDDLFLSVKSNLIKHKQLTSRRDLLVAMDVITFAPGTVRSDDNWINSATELDRYFNDLPNWQNSNLFENLVSVIQVATKIRRSETRIFDDETSRGAKMAKLSAAISTLDYEQAKAVLETSDGLQRIRGLAGSGKTIVLAMKVAYLHSTFPDWKIGVTYHTRSLKQQFDRLISMFTIEQVGFEPSDNVRVAQTWGSSVATGIYYEFCRAHGVPFRDFRSAKAQADQVGADPFDFVCTEALSAISEPNPQYDIILIDEAQDVPQSFLKMCVAFIREPKRLVWAYDELQQLGDQREIDIEAVFGEGFILQNEPGKPKKDIILYKCYRNSRPVLAVAHALGFGVYRSEGLVQMFGDENLWKDVGYVATAGGLRQGQYVELSRTEDSSPTFLEDIDRPQEIIRCAVNADFEAECIEIAADIERNLNVEKLGYRDIMVIYSEATKLQERVGPLRKILLDKNINSHIAGVSTSPDQFFQDDSIVFTSIYRAKGNEAAFVYVMDAHLNFGGSYNLQRKRNILFTAITRSRGWVRLMGYGPSMEGLKEEFDRVVQNGYKLCFTYPTAEQLKEMRTVYRNVSPDDEITIDRSKKSIEEVLEALQSGRLKKRDLPKDLKNAIKQYLLEDEE